MRRLVKTTVGAALLGLLLASCTEHYSALEQVKRSGELRVLTRHSAVAYYDGPHGPAGLEYELARRFAEHLGARLQILPAPNLETLFSRLRAGKAAFAAAGLAVTPGRKRWLRFTPPYQSVVPQLIYRSTTPKPASLDALSGHLEVAAESSHAERLDALKPAHPELRWYANPKLSCEELLTLVSEQVLDYTVVNSNDFALNRRFYPELRVAFPLGKPEPLAWAFPRNQDESLYREAVAFFARLKASGELARLIERHYGHVKDYDYVGTRAYLRHVHERLPRYQEQFEQAAEDNKLDWRLLAAMAYQESHWNPRAVSPTGVRGMMMLTLATAEHIGIDKRTDPTQSIDGGARYLRWVLDQLPPEIAEPDRTWMAIAAYNVGLGHLQDARELAARRGDDPDKWVDVKKTLPLLRERKWYRKTAHGYARGNEPVRYVENVRSYYDILVWTADRQHTPRTAPRALSITAPVL